MSPADDPLERLIEVELQRLRSLREAKAAKSKSWRARYSAKQVAAQGRRRRSKLKCAARTRRGTACQRKALANGRCPSHGGLSTGPKREAGRQRISEAQHRRWGKRRDEQGCKP